jgi:hypothetical protein
MRRRLLDRLGLGRLRVFGRWTRLTPRTQLAAIAGGALVLALIPVLLTLLPASGAPRPQGMLAGASGATGTRGTGGAAGARGSTPGATAARPTATATTESPGITSGGQSVGAGTGCKYLSSPTTASAFCDDFSEGPNAGGRGGDLDESKWSVARVVGGYSNTNMYSFPQTPVLPCRSGVSSVGPDSDIVMCDSSSGHGGQIETAMSAQNYALLSMRPRQAFDFTNRTGTITFNTDAVTAGGGGWWTSVWVTDIPDPLANNSLQVTGGIPHYGIGINFDGNNCADSGGGQMRINSVYLHSNYAESEVSAGNGTCVATKRGLLNHIEVRLSQTSVQVYASDYSTDGVTFPNFQLIGSATIALPFSVGYVHFQQAERAPIKYGYTPSYANNFWSGLGFDGPVVAPEIAYEVPDALTPSNGSLNLGYGLLTNGTTFTCCTSGQATTTGPLNLANVNLTRVTSATLAFSVGYTFTGNSPSALGIQYRLNNGPLRTPSPTPDFVGATQCQAWGGTGPCNWAMNFAFSVPVSDLVQGTNTLEIVTSGTNDGWAPILANVDLLTYG